MPLYESRNMLMNNELPNGPKPELPMRSRGCSGSLEPTLDRYFLQLKKKKNTEKIYRSSKLVFSKEKIENRETSMSFLAEFFI